MTIPERRALADVLDSHPLARVAWHAAAAAGAFLKDERPIDLLVDTKSSPSDAVTQMDRTAEALISAALLGSRPDDGLLGEVVEPPADLHEKRQQFPPRAAHVGRERAPFEELHGEPGLPVRDPDVVERHDVGMPQLLEDARLPQEAASGVVQLTRRTGEEHLQRDDARGRALVLGGVDDAHASLSQLSQGAVGPEPGWEGGRHSRSIMRARTLPAS